MCCYPWGDGQINTAWRCRGGASTSGHFAPGFRSRGEEFSATGILPRTIIALWCRM